MTSLLSGERVPKSHVRIEACGELDALASVLGALAASLAEDQEVARAEIRQIQGELLHAGAWLAVTPGSPTLGLLKPPSEASVEASADAGSREVSESSGELTTGVELDRRSLRWACLKITS